jgi:HK97 gp10 family phage protein
LELQIAKSAEEIVREMRALVPKDTGAVALSIGWTWGNAPKGTVAVAQSAATRGDGLRATIFAGGGEQFYARFLEFGTVRMAARPFFFPVYRANRRRVIGRINRAVRKAARQS